MDLLYREAAFFVANIAIFLGYLFVAVFVMPHFPVKLLKTKIGGVVFFVTCGLTHIEHALHTFGGGEYERGDLLSWHMLVIHVIQAISVWFFVTGLYEEFGKMRTLSELERRLEEEHDDAVPLDEDTTT